jgi:leader peptidase (prepilin peptidase)/N-methyltransferase
MVVVWLVLVFLLGAVVGSFVNVCVARLPLEKSILWPGSRCSKCLQPVRWYDNLPLVSYWLLRGRCRSCGQRFSIQYFLVELLTGLGFAGLFYLVVVRNLHRWPGGQAWAMQIGHYPWQWWVGWGYHACLFAFLMAASVTDLNGREIPLQLTVAGTVVGLIGSVLFPWPWPWPPAQAVPAPRPDGLEWQLGAIVQGLYPWPVWGPLPAWLAPGGNWQTGLATGLAGMVFGSVFLRAVGFLFSTGLGKEALGLGDADLMMMAGAFLGWQPVLVAFFISVFPALVVGVVQLVVRGDNSLPFGPSLAMGVILTFLGWGVLGPYVQPILFWGTVLICLAALAAAFMLGSSFLLRVLRG